MECHKGFDHCSPDESRVWIWWFKSSGDVFVYFLLWDVWPLICFLGDLLRILPSYITMKPAFGEYVLTFSNHLKQIYVRELNICFLVPKM